MADDGGTSPLPRRVPGATVSPGQDIRRERFVIPEDLRQRVLTAIADELQRDEAETQRRAQEQAPSPASDLDQAASARTVWSPVPRPPDFLPPDLDREADQAAASAPDQAASARTVWSPVPRPPDFLPPDLGREADQAAVPDQPDRHAPAADWPGPRPAGPLPRRTPGTNGAPPPPAHVRRNFLPPSLLGHRLDSDLYTEPIPRITGFRPGIPAAPDRGPRAEDPAAAPTLPAGAPWFVPTPPGSAPLDSGEAEAAPSAGAFPELAASAGLTQELPPPAVEVPLTAPASPAPADSPGPSLPPNPDGKQPRSGAAVTARMAPSAGKKQERSGRRYRVAGLLVAVIVLIAAALVAFLLSSHAGTAGNGHAGLGAPGAGAGERNAATSWIAS